MPLQPAFKTHSSSARRVSTSLLDQMGRVVAHPRLPNLCQSLRNLAAFYTSLRPDARHHRLRPGARTTRPTRTSLPKAPSQGLSLYDSAPSPHAGCPQTLYFQKNSQILILVPFPFNPMHLIWAKCDVARQLNMSGDRRLDQWYRFRLEDKWENHLSFPIM
jgi:hypothetical protein